KILITMLVIFSVGIFFRSKNQSAAVQAPKTNTSTAAQSSLAPKTVAYLLIALLILVSGVVYYFSWSDRHQLVTLRVINANNDLSEYQAYRTDIKGREFTSIDGKLVRLADSDRIEMIVHDQ
ncbi:MAG: hypothetical protein V3V09_05915, partial [Arenicellales bacterium]